MSPSWPSSSRCCVPSCNIADEAHRSLYDFIDGYPLHMRVADARATRGDSKKNDPRTYAVCTIDFEDPDSDAATYRVVKFGFDTADEAFRDLAKLKKLRKYAKKDLVVIQHVEPE